MFQLWKNCFLHKWNIGLKGSSTFQRKITTRKHDSVFSLKTDWSNWWGRKYITRSFNKTFKQALCFFSNLTSYLSVSELVKMLLQAFSGNPIYVYIYINIKSIGNVLNIVSSAVIFSTTIEYGTSPSSIDSNELFYMVFSHLICRWLVGASKLLDLHVIDKALSA